MDAARDYGQDEELAKQFLRQVYGPNLTKLANREAVHMFIELAEVEKFNLDLNEQILNNTERYTKIFLSALDHVLPGYKTREFEEKDPMDIFIEQRLLVAERNRRAQASASQSTRDPSHVDIDGRYPPDLIRRAEAYFKPSSFRAIPIREVKAKYLGKFVTIRGIVTRTSDVKPKITVATYTCNQCGCETFQPVKGLDFTPLFECTSAACKSNKTIGKIIMQTRGSKFVKCQEVKLQEHSDQVPTGHIPRTITVMLHGELTRSCAPGDHISVSGVFLPIERSGFRARTGGLTADTYIETHYVTQMNKTEDDELDIEPMSSQEADEFLRGQNNFLAKISSSIAPEIYGHEELKKALLLLLVGGVNQNSFGMKIRGNINICIMGDPGVAKSQLLSFIDRLASRSQYTTGRGSSGVGLTAAVLKDPITNELVLEGGALVLADKGICCIDEFDKMMDADRTAIHEVMEQQTVSIAKAGIMTTLNARVSILAAANPAYGRYNMSKTVSDNLELPPALLSRFDLIWLIIDTADQTKDQNLAKHVIHVHRNPGEQAPDVDQDIIDMKTMRRYISLCQQKNPVIPESMSKKLADIYLSIRKRSRYESRNEGTRKRDTMFTSPRSLLAILRLTTAFARLRLADTVEEEDIDAAVDLYESSRISIERHDKGPSVGQRILELVKRICEESEENEVSRQFLTDLAEEFNEEQINEALTLLEEFGTIAIEGDKIVLL